MFSSDKRINKMDKIFIGDVSFTPRIRTIEKEGKEVKLRNKESEILTLLYENYPHPVSRQQIEQSIWAGSYVTENTLTQTISNLRNAINDKNHEVIITIPKKGYCLTLEPKTIYTEDLKIPERPTDLIEKSERALTFNTLSFSTWLIGTGIFLLVFLLSFLLFFDRNQINVFHFKPQNLPITINLDKDIDAEFLHTYKKPPYLLLKKNSDNSYLVCEPYKGGLTCLRK